MKVLSAIRKENEKWVFDYLADTDPSGELQRAGAILSDHHGGDVRPGSGWHKVEYRGFASTRLNSEAALTVIQARLLGWGWSLRPKVDQ
jgi:hypothetical protein